jgi:hypothetical protein
LRESASHTAGQQSRRNREQSGPHPNSHAHADR